MPRELRGPHRRPWPASDVVVSPTVNSQRIALLSSTLLISFREIRSRAEGALFEEVVCEQPPGLWSYSYFWLNSS